MKPRNLLEHALEIVTLWYGGRLALRGQMDFGELSSAVLVAQTPSMERGEDGIQHGLNMV